MAEHPKLRLKHLSHGPIGHATHHPWILHYRIYLVSVPTHLLVQKCFRLHSQSLQPVCWPEGGIVFSGICHPLSSHITHPSYGIYNALRVLCKTHQTLNMIRHINRLITKSLDSPGFRNHYQNNDTGQTQQSRQQT